MALSQSAPRFVAEARGACYGSRDEIIGWTVWSVECVAETRAWLQRQLDALPEYYAYELDWRIIDRNPERELENWGPRPSAWSHVYDHDAREWVLAEADDLPF